MNIFHTTETANTALIWRAYF